MKMMDYKKQLQHPLWKAKKKSVLTLNGFKCQLCGVKNVQLEIHHPFYRRGVMAWEYMDDELQCLCHECHKARHFGRPRKTEGLPASDEVANKFFAEMRALLGD